MLELIYTSTKTVTTGSGLSNISMCYLRTWDAMILHDWNAPAKAYKLFRDGSQAVIIPVVINVKLVGRVYGRHGWREIYGSGRIFPVDEISGNYHSETNLNENWVPDNNALLSLTQYVDDVRHIVICQHSGRMNFIDLTTGTVLGTMLNGTSINHIAWLGEGRIVAVECSTGKVYFIDYLNRVIVFQTTVAPCIAAAYDCTHNLIITLGSDLLVRVYTLDVAPAVLSAPAFVPAAAHQHQLIGSRVRTRLTGDAGEPCEDYWIHWALLGLPAKGELHKDKSKTDAAGYAENYYFGPRTVGEIGEETIRVSVQVPS